MKKLEEELRKEDITYEKVRNMQKMNAVIQDNLLKGKRGTLRRKRKEEKKEDERRRAEREKEIVYKGQTKSLDRTATMYKKKMIQMQSIKSIPSHYKKRIDFFYEEYLQKESKKDKK